VVAATVKEIYFFFTIITPGFSLVFVILRWFLLFWYLNFIFCFFFSSTFNMSTTAGDIDNEEFTAYQLRLRDSNTLYTKLSIADLIKVVKEECAIWSPMLDNQDSTEEEFESKIAEWTAGHSKNPILQALFDYKEAAL